MRLYRLIISFCDFAFLLSFSFFFFNATATTEIYTLSLHDALPIFPERRRTKPMFHKTFGTWPPSGRCRVSIIDIDSKLDRKSTRLNSSHVAISYAVFCLKKKKKKKKQKAQQNTSKQTQQYNTID